MLGDLLPLGSPYSALDWKDWQSSSLLSTDVLFTSWLISTELPPTIESGRGPRPGDMADWSILKP